MNLVENRELKGDPGEKNHQKTGDPISTAHHKWTEHL